METDHEEELQNSTTKPDPDSPVPGELLFATFQPPSSSGIRNLDKLEQLEPNLFSRFGITEESRIVVTPDSRNPGQYVWTFVPSAKGKGESNIKSSEWPRIVSVLGEPQMMMQNRWDEYKCNPEFECFVSSNGAIPAVTQRGSTLNAASPVQSPTPPKDPRPRSSTPHPGVKRSGSGTIEDDISPRKRPKTFVESDSSDDIEEMNSGSHHDYLKAKLWREKERQNRHDSRVRNAPFRMSSMLDNLPTVNQGRAAFTRATFSPDFNGAPMPKPTKEKYAMETDPVQTKRRQSSDHDINMSSTKRARFSPYPFHSDHAQEHKPHFVRRKRVHIADPRNPGAFKFSKVKEKDFWQDVDFDQLKGQTFSLDADATPEPAASSTNLPEFNDEPETYPPSSQDPIYVDDSEDDELDETENELDGDSPKRKGKGRATEQDYEDGEDAEARRRRLQESRRKLEEINSHDYERQAAKARAEEQARRQKEEAAKRRAEERTRKAEAAQRAQAEQRRQEQARRREYADSRFSEDYYFFHTRAPWAEDEYTSPSGTNFSWFNSYPPPPSHTHSRTQNRTRVAPPSPSKPRWTAQQALERYNKLSEAFDNFKPSPSLPVPSMDQIPWPVLLAPGFTLDQVDWTAVEEFFRQAETLMGGKSYGKVKWKEFVKTSTRRFHPDRWRARGLIGEKGFGSDVEDKVNHVAKVLTPLYRAIG